MMSVSDYVVDTNVWLFAARDLSQIQDLMDIACAEAALAWINQFFDSQSRLIVDWDYKILGEYRNKANQQINVWLNALERQPRTRLLEVEIEWESYSAECVAKLPLEFEAIDRSDRKFLAVLLKHCQSGSQARLVNASDTDWSIAIERYPTLVPLILELCPEYIAAHRARPSSAAG